MHQSWAEKFATRATGLVRSEVRSLFALAADPAYVNLAGGSPDIGALPLDEIAELTRNLIATRGTEALQYGVGQGSPELREQLTVVMAEEDIPADADDLIVTTGSQQALDLICKVFIDPGDVILAEGPTYVGALATFRAYEADVIHVDQDACGIIPDRLESTLASLAAAGRAPKMLYVIPNFQNPSGATLSAERRRQVVSLAERYGVLIVEDNPYGLIRYEHDPSPALKSLHPEGVVYLGSLSKTFSAGLRIGWAAAPTEIVERLVSASESSVLSPSMYTQLTAATYLADYDWLQQVKVFRELYRDKRDVMVESIGEMLPKSAFVTPQGGFFVWLTIPGDFDSKKMLPHATAAHVVYTPGTGFYADGRGSNNIRLSFSSPSTKRIRDGIRRLSSVIDG